MKLSEELAWRGFAKQTTLEDNSKLDTEKFAFYLGVDPSANSMTVGNLVPAIMVKHFINHGHKAFLLIGGATGQIGDPDGKSEERDLKSLKEVEENKTGIVAEYKRLFNNEVEIVDNYTWFKDIGYLQFLREVGKHFSMTQLLDRDFVQSRIGEGGSGISYAEFSYSLIQGYDFLHLFRKYGVNLQICGSDQWGNSISGVELIRKLEGKAAHVWTAPLVINKVTGKKFGKSEAGAVWLNEDKTSVYKFYQFWLNVDDEGVIDYLKIYTFLGKEEIESLTEKTQLNPKDRIAQKKLAFEVTKIVHGAERANQAVKVTNVLFGQESFTDLSKQELDLLAKEIPTSNADSIVDVLVDTKAAKSKSEARRLIESGSVYTNFEKSIIEDSRGTEPKLIKKGKNNFILWR